ncbi:MAG: hypothetical protein F7C81_01260 [Desulfurococcales archaeon]|nr:hypothetical protein [Desulfurococcales archaeon]
MAWIEPPPKNRDVEDAIMAKCIGFLNISTRSPWKYSKYDEAHAVSDMINIRAREYLLFSMWSMNDMNNIYVDEYTIIMNIVNNN